MTWKNYLLDYKTEKMKEILDIFSDAYLLQIWNDTIIDSKTFRNTQMNVCMSNPNHVNWDYNTGNSCCRILLHSNLSSNGALAYVKCKP